MTQLKKQKVKKQLILSVATRGGAGNWRDPEDESRYLSRDLDEWVKLAQLAERGKLHSIFFVDHLSWFDVYGGDHSAAARTGTNAARVSPTEIVTALSIVTKNVGFGMTISTASEHPYHFARRLATLDHLTKGRIGWNIVTSYIPSVGSNLLNGGPLPEHNERYNRAQEYVDATYELLLSSWRDDAIVYDKESGVFADPKAIRKINHKGKYFDIPGPAITEPSIQRFPLIIQAGSSPRGKLFAAENAELVYVGIEDHEKTRILVDEIRTLAKEKFGRNPKSIKFIAPINAFVAKTHEEAIAKQEAYKKLQDPEYPLIYFGGTSGIDVSKLGWDEPIPINGESNGIKGSLDKIKASKGGLNKTKRQLVDSQINERTKFVGTPSEIADLIEKVIEETDIDGFNFQTLNTFPRELEDVVDLLIPELQKRGLAQRDYAVDGGTLRENFFGVKGQTFVSKDHPAHNLRWNKGVSKESFEKTLKEHKKKRGERRAAVGIHI